MPRSSSNPKTRPDDRRGAKRGSRKGTAHEGKPGNPPHERNEKVAQMVELLKGYGLTTAQIQNVIERNFGEGYSKKTLERHYREELDRGMAVSLAEYLNRSHQMATMKNIPSGVSMDKAYEIASRKLSWMLGTIHGLKPNSTDLGGGQINITITADDAEL